MELKVNTKYNIHDKVHYDGEDYIIAHIVIMVFDNRLSIKYHLFAKFLPDHWVFEECL